MSQGLYYELKPYLCSTELVFIPQWKVFEACSALNPDVFVPFIIYPLLHGSPDHLPLTGVQHSPLPVYSPNYLWSLISFLKASFHSNTAWWRSMLLLQRWRRGGAGGAWTRTWCVKSNCFYISSCWLLISSTVYLHLFWGMCKLLACVSVHVCVQQLPKYRGRQLAVLRAVGGMFKPQSAGDSV